MTFLRDIVRFYVAPFIGVLNHVPVANLKQTFEETISG